MRARSEHAGGFLLGAVLAALFVLSACGGQPVHYREVELLPPLQVPPDLHPPRRSQEMAIPGLPLNDLEAVRRLADQAPGEEIELPPALQLRAPQAEARQAEGGPH